MGHTVRATKKGYYGRLREPGDVFEISDDKHFSKNWMETVAGQNDDAPQEPTAPPSGTEPASKTPPAAKPADGKSGKQKEVKGKTAKAGTGDKDVI